MPVYRKNNKFLSIPYNSSYVIIVSKYAAEYHVIKDLAIGKRYRIRCDAIGNLTAELYNK